MTPPANRASLRLDWTRHVLGNAHLTLVAASTDASSRSYWRTQDGANSWIVMDSPPTLEDPRLWLAINGRLAAAGLHVPSVRAHDLQQGFLVIEDLGSQMYLDVLNEANVDGLYDPALDALLRMQTSVEVHDLPAYDRTFLSHELELMPEWFLRRHLGCTLACEEWDAMKGAFSTLVHVALEQPRCFVHRDYHSRNLLVVDPHDAAAEHMPWLNPGIIDFQGAMHGPITYDLVSLLRDCYIAWDGGRVEAWAGDYRQQLLGTNFRAAIPDRASFLRWFDLMGLQRHLKVLGIFSRLHYRDGKSGYLADLPRVFRYVDEIAGRYPEFKTFTNLLRRHVGGRDLSVVANR